MDIESKNNVSYSGMMYTHDFKAWYTCLKMRLDNEWTVEDLSFLLGKPPYYYADFEKMFKVDHFLVKENALIRRIYGEFCADKMEFHKNDYEINEE